MNIFYAAILGVVEGITEFLPISSTGHLILSAKLLGLQNTEFLKSFEIFIQSGAILAVLWVYWRDLTTKTIELKKVLVAFIPTAVVGLIMYKFIKMYLLGNVPVVLWSLALGGIVLLAIEMRFKRHPKENGSLSQVTYRQAFLVGLVQSVSIIPGVSRSAASIIGGMLFGMDRKTAVEFSFLLAIPTLLAATGLDLIKTSINFNANEWSMLGVGFLASFVSAMFVIKWFLSYVRKYTLIPFGIYRIVLAIFLFGLFFL